MTRYAHDMHYRYVLLLLTAGVSCVGQVEDASPEQDADSDHHHHHVDGDPDTDSDSDTASDSDLSEACTTFCTCMASNCSDKVFPNAGCLSECTTHPKWDMGCRQVMCTLAPVQPDNNHCTHAMGEFECLDLP